MNFTNQNLRWIDYSALSIIGGFESFTDKIIKYCRIAPQTCLCSYYLRGIGNADNITFTLPFAAADAYACSYLLTGTALSMDTAVLVIPSAISINTASGVEPSGWSVFYGLAGIGDWAATGTNDCRGQFFFQTT